MAREDIIRKIRALQERTTAQGCSEHEALSAARIAAKLLAEHGLAMTDLEIKERDCEKGTIETGRGRSHEINSCIMAIAKFTDCECWRSKRGGVSYHFFGFPEDVQTARWLYQTILTAMVGELSTFKRQCHEQDLPTGRQQSHSFLLGMASRVSARLLEMKWAQSEETRETTGRDLVVVKSAVVKEQFGELHLHLRSKKQRSHSGDAGAYGAGRNAGNRVGFNQSVAGGTALLR